MTARLRLVVFSPSIISDIGNPQASTVRAICQAFTEAGHDVTHLEERGNPHLRELLLRHGSGPLRDFNKRYPLIRYRQYDLTRGWERVIWFGREIATADVVVAYPGVDDAVIQEVAAISSPRIIAFWPGASGETRKLLPHWYAPVEPSDGSEAPDSKRYVVAYDNYAESIGTDAGTRASALATGIERLLARRQPCA